LLLTPLNLAANIKSNQMRSTLVVGGKVTAERSREKKFAATAAHGGRNAFERTRSQSRENTQNIALGGAATHAEIIA
jgi:hypothetical protein